ncbi:MAG: short-chain dehydrogenase [Alphaproteobacteria bacterium HGW-Alphaproteobacteria-2]|nr:MAG: short-chain dehydrogenase [Alphaproteobacteria bacterium HGW-Alphaproteobacteria-2]
MVEGRFAGRVVLITGAGSGFGAAAARAFATEGASLALSDRDGAALAAVADGLRVAGAKVLAAEVDVTEEADVAGHVADVLARLGRLDVAVNNAGVCQALLPLAETPLAEYERMMAVNARGVFLGLKHQLPLMVAQGAGAILNIASAAGLVGAGGLAAYAASKHAVVGLTRAAADEVARHGVRVNALCPAFADTPLFAELAAPFAEVRGIDRAGAEARIASRVPMQRVARTDEVVQAMLWACAPENSFMTGQAIAIDGGLTAV